MLEAIKNYVAANATSEGKWLFDMLVEHSVLTVAVLLLGIATTANLSGAAASWLFDKGIKRSPKN